MAAGPILNSILECSFVCAAEGQYSFNVRHFRVTSVIGNTVTDQTIADQLSGLAGTEYKAHLATRAVYWGLKVQIISPLKLVPVTSAIGRGQGEAAGDILPVHVAAVGYMKTDRAGRSYRGRCYFPFASEEANTVDGDPGLDFRTNCLSTLSVIAGPRVVNDGQGGSVQLAPVVLSRKLGTTSDILSIGVRVKWGTMRSRAEIMGGDVDPLT